MNPARRKPRELSQTQRAYLDAFDDFLRAGTADRGAASAAKDQMLGALLGDSGIDIARVRG
jgi:hypothetical protein